MEIQSLSIVVPTKGCVNNCKYCVSRTHENEYDNLIEDHEIRGYIHQQYQNRLQFAKDNGCNSVIFTGTGEPLQNKDFIKQFMTMFNAKVHPSFYWFELQTTGVMLDHSNLTFLRNYDFSTISLSLSNIFDSLDNGLICDIPGKLLFDIDDLCKLIKSFGFNLRLSLNMTSAYNDKSVIDILNRAKELQADQITFRQLYKSSIDCKQNKWIEGNSVGNNLMGKIKEYIKSHGTQLETLPFGSTKYSVMGMGTVIDEDCMVKTTNTSIIRYLILRENAKLYSRWDDKASLIF